jgi:exosome complex RNA-binding protein Rrp42 (RNase PH superfamily)
MRSLLSEYSWSRPSVLTDAGPSASVIPLSSLVIEPDKAAWVLYIDATCINYDGNVFDAALIAMVAALRNSAYLGLRHQLELVLSFIPSQITES